MGPVWAGLTPKLEYEYLSDEENLRFLVFLAANPTAGDVIQGTGGLRKVRWGESERGKGKRGGVRIIYYFFQPSGPFLVLTINGADA